jgi:hypothetical protein
LVGNAGNDLICGAWEMTVFTARRVQTALKAVTARTCCSAMPAMISFLVRREKTS